MRLLKTNKPVPSPKRPGLPPMGPIARWFTYTNNPVANRVFGWFATTPVWKIQSAFFVLAFACLIVVLFIG